MKRPQKLSPKQQELLDVMKRGVRVYYVSGIDGHYFRADNLRPCTKQVLALLAKGLVSVNVSGECKQVIKDEGDSS